jgi:hemoglobin/transferrin/lactoferrin receptor protein
MYGGNDGQHTPIKLYYIAPGSEHDSAAKINVASSRITYGKIALPFYIEPHPYLYPVKQRSIHAQHSLSKALLLTGRSINRFNLLPYQSRADKYPNSSDIRRRIKEGIIALVLLAGLGSTPTSAEPEERPSRLEPLTVTAGRVPQLENQVMTPVSVMDRDRIEQLQARNIDDMLRMLPGVTTQGGPRPEAMMPNIRGLGDNRVVTRLDGARQNLLLDHRGQVFLDPMMLDRVEVLRGPGSTLYGHGAIGGVVNFHTLDAADFLRPDQKFGGRVMGGYMVNGNQRFGAANLAGQVGDFGLMGSFTRRRANNFTDGNGETVPLTNYDMQSGFLKGSWRPTEDQRVTFSYLDFEDDSPSLLTADRPTGDRIRRNTRSQTATVNYHYTPVDNLAIDLHTTFYWTKTVLDERFLDVAGAQQNELSTVGMDAFNTSRFSIAGTEHTMTYGVELFQDEQIGTENGQPRPGFANSTQRTMGVFFSDRIDVTDRLAFTAGIRYDNVGQEADNPEFEDNSLSSLNPQISGSYRLFGGLNAYASYAEAFRAPGLRELFIGGPHFPGNEYIPNPNLKPEKAHNIEVGLNYFQGGLFTDQDRLKGTLNIFQNNIDDFIDQVVRDTTTRFENVVEARIEGIEAELRYDHPWYYLMAVGSVLRGDDLRRGEPLQSIPADEIIVEGAWRWSGEGLGRWLSGARVNAVREQERVPERPHTIDSTPSYIVYDLFLTWLWKDQVRLDLGIDNLTNETYRPHLMTINQRGRNFKAQLSYRF